MIDALVACDASFFNSVEDAVEEFAAVMRGEMKTYAQCSDKELADLIDDIGLDLAPNSAVKE
jgi:hypothetical protein